MTRVEHLAWCKERALAALDGGDVAGAVASMLFDLGRWDEPLYAPEIFQVLAADGLLHARFGDTAGLRRWIEGFG